MTTCTVQNTITAGDIDGLNKDIDTISEVVESTALTAETKNGRTIDTLTGRLLKLGYMVPIPYEAGIVFSETDNTKTIERDGIIYAPYPGSLPFTTSGTWDGDDADKFYPIQGQLYANTLSDLRAIPPGSALYINVLGHTGVSDGGGGVFALHQGGTPGEYVDDDGITAVPDGGDGSSAWRRQYNGWEVDLAWWGPASSDPAANAARLLKAEAACSVLGGTIKLLAGAYQMNGVQSVAANIIYQGAGGSGLLTDLYPGASTLQIMDASWGYVWNDGTQQRQDPPTFKDVTFQNGTQYDGSDGIALGGLRIWSGTQGRLYSCGFHGFPIGFDLYGLDETHLAQRECQYWEVYGIKSYFCANSIRIMHGFSNKFFGGQLQGAPAGDRNYAAGSVGVLITALAGVGASDANRFEQVNSQFFETCYKLDGSAGTVHYNQFYGCRCEAFLYGYDIIGSARNLIKGAGFGNYILQQGDHGTGIRIDADSNFNDVEVLYSNDLISDIDNQNEFTKILDEKNRDLASSPRYSHRKHTTAALYLIQDDDVYVEYAPSAGGELRLPLIEDKSDADGVEKESRHLYVRCLADTDANDVTLTANPDGGALNNIKYGERSVKSLLMMQNKVLHLISTQQGNNDWLIIGDVMADGLPLLNMTVADPPTQADVQLIANRCDAIVGRLVEGQFITDAG